VWLRDGDAFVAMSRAIRDEFLGAGVPPQKVALIPHGVDTARFRPATPDERLALRQRLGLPIDGRIIIYTGRLLRGKGLEDLITAFRLIAAAEPSAHLVIVGSGEGHLSVEPALHAATQAEPLAARVTFAGRVDAVEDWLRASDVFAFPSIFEALGIALVEAAACGLPAVASRTGGIVDVVDDGRSGVLVPTGDISALWTALHRLVTDADLRREMGAAAHEVALARFDERDAVDRYRGLFREVAGRAGRA
jgi:glycosyltransferase involved in cell wall biosynthesis